MIKTNRILLNIDQYGCFFLIFLDLAVLFLFLFSAAILIRVPRVYKHKAMCFYCGNLMFYMCFWLVLIWTEILLFWFIISLWIITIWQIISTWVIAIWQIISCDSKRTNIFLIYNRLILENLYFIPYCFMEISRDLPNVFCKRACNYCSDSHFENILICLFKINLSWKFQLNPMFFSWDIFIKKRGLELVPEQPY